MAAKSRALERSQFIKLISDERIACQATIAVKAIKVESKTAAKKAGPFAIQILRGPLRSETEIFYLPQGPINMPVDLQLSRMTTMYRVEDGSFQKKLALIRVLHLAPAQSKTATKKSQTQRNYSPEKGTRAKIVEEF